MVCVNPGREVLQELYWERGLSCVEIGKILGVANISVLRYMRREGIKSRTLSEARSLAAKKYPNSEKQRESARRQAHIARAGQTPESFRKMVATRKEKGVNYCSGPDNHMWRGGTTPRLRMRVWINRARECYERDGWLCGDCRCECLSANEAQEIDPKRRVQAHHIVARRNGGNDELENLVTLCLSCHRKREALFASALFA